MTKPLSKAERITLWNAAHVAPTKARRSGDAYDFDYLPAGFGIYHPTIGLIEGYRTKQAAIEDLMFARTHGVQPTFLDTMTDEDLVTFEVENLKSLRDERNAR